MPTSVHELPLAVSLLLALVVFAPTTAADAPADPPADAPPIVAELDELDRGELEQLAISIQRDFESTQTDYHDQPRLPAWLSPMGDAPSNQRTEARQSIDEMNRALDDTRPAPELREAVDQARTEVMSFGYYVSKSDHVRQIYADIATSILVVGGLVVLVVILAWQAVSRWRRYQEPDDTELP